MTFIPQVVPTLRPYQTDAIDKLREAMLQGAKKPLLVMPTGAGKTVTFAEVARRSLGRNRRVLVLAHRQELIRQAGNKLAAVGVPYGIVMPGEPRTDHAVQVASIQTMINRLDEHQPFGLIIVDEAHHSTATTYKTVLEKWPDAFVLGVTATPERLDGKGLGDIFDAMVLGPSVKDLIKLGALCSFTAYSGTEADLSNVKTVMGDYNQKQLKKAVAKATLVGDMVETYAKYANNLSTLAYGVSIEHAEMIAEEFNDAGIPAAAVSGKTHKDVRARALRDLQSGAIKVLASCEVFGEGIDLPNVSAVILARPTQSLTIHLQQIGRGLRPAQGKHQLIILDHAGNCRRHGLPNREHGWSLEGREKKAAPEMEQKEDGSLGEAKPREVVTVAGNLEKLNSEAPPSNARPAHATDAEWNTRLVVARRLNVPPNASEENLRMIGAMRGYKAGWAWHAHRKLAGIEPLDDPSRPFVRTYSRL